jgi:hypothetical protein
MRCCGPFASSRSNAISPFRGCRSGRLRPCDLTLRSQKEPPVSKERMGLSDSIAPAFLCGVSDTQAGKIVFGGRRSRIVVSKLDGPVGAGTEARPYRRCASRKDSPRWASRYGRVSPLCRDLPTILRTSRGSPDFVAPMKNVEWVEVRPLHQLGAFKWKAMELAYKHADTPAPSPELVRRVIAQFHAAGCHVR